MATPSNAPQHSSSACAHRSTRAVGVLTRPYEPRPEEAHEQGLLCTDCGETWTSPAGARRAGAMPRVNPGAIIEADPPRTLAGLEAALAYLAPRRAAHAHLAKRLQVARDRAMVGALQGAGYRI